LSGKYLIKLIGEAIWTRSRGVFFGFDGFIQFIIGYRKVKR